MHVHACACRHAFMHAAIVGGTRTWTTASTSTQRTMMRVAARASASTSACAGMGAYTAYTVARGQANADQSRLCKFDFRVAQNAHVDSTNSTISLLARVFQTSSEPQNAQESKQRTWCETMCFVSTSALGGAIGEKVPKCTRHIGDLLEKVPKCTVQLWTF